MDVTLTDEEEFLAKNAARVAADLRTAAAPEGRLDAATAWAALEASGLVAMRAEQDPAERASAVDVALCVEAFGAAVSPAPLVGALLAVELLRLAGDDRPGASATRPTIALAGDLSGVAHVSEPDCKEVVAGAPGTRTLGTDHRRPPIAFDALGATSAVGLVTAGAGRAIGTVELVDPVAAWAAADATGSADLSRVLRPVPRTPVEGPGLRVTDDAYDRWRSFALVALCADMVGAMDGALGMAVEYARNRRQYGRPIGSFQAVQHLCAEQHVSVEASRSVTYWAAWAVDALDPDGALHAATVAKAYVARVCRPVVEAVLQVHGGIGQTWECDAHRHLRRVLLDRAVLGDEHEQERVLRRKALGDPPTA